MPKQLKSPLRFPGGKSRAVKHIAPLVPDSVKTIVSPFLGGGSLELYWAQTGKTVIASDLFKPLTAFWRALMDQPCNLADRVQEFFPLSKEGFYSLQRAFNPPNELFDSGVAFFVLNRSSFSGSTLSGGCSDPGQRFTQSSIDRLRDFERFDGNLFISNRCWEFALARYRDDFLYLDPPYIITPQLYGVKGDMHKNFDHYALSEGLRSRSAPWLLSYNDSANVRGMYREFNIREAEWSYGMGKNKTSKELIISNY